MRRLTFLGVAAALVCGAVSEPAAVAAPPAPAPEPSPATEGPPAAAAPQAPVGRPPLPALDAPIQVFLNDPKVFDRPLDQCSAEVCTSLLALIGRAETSVDFAIYGMRNQTAVLRALEAARKRGVTIRGVVDRDGSGRNYYSSTEDLARSVETLRSDVQTEIRMAAEEEAKRSIRGIDHDHGCPRPEGFEGPLQCLSYDLGDQCLMAGHASREAMETSGAIMHNKFFVVDGRWLWTGSTNVSDSGTGGYNANLVAVLDSPMVATWYTHEFEEMYVLDRYHHEKRGQGRLTTTLADGTRVDAYFSPQDEPLTRALRPLIQKATHRIDVAVFFLTHKRVAKDLIDAHRRGVEVRVILDATAATNGYSKHELLRVAGIPLKIENWGGKMHLKAAAFDGEILVVGSMNWTSAGEGGNDENTLVLHSAPLAKQFEEYFDRTWDTIPDAWLAGRPDAESLDSTTACFDGVDNDFDHRADHEDPGCLEGGPPLKPLPPWRLVRKGPGEGLIKGDVNEYGVRTYHVPGGAFYFETDIDAAKGERWFCSEDDAREAGWTRARR